MSFGERNKILVEKCNGEKLQDIVDKDIRVSLAKKPSKRVCLQCDNTFMSQWSGNRICTKCTDYRRNAKNRQNAKGDSNYGI